MYGSVCVEFLQCKIISPQISPTGPAGSLTAAHNNKRTCCVSQTLTRPGTTSQRVLRPFSQLGRWPGPVWCWSRFSQFPLASIHKHHILRNNRSRFTVETCLNLSLKSFFLEAFYFCFHVANLLTVGSHVLLLLCPRAKTLKEYTCSLDVTVSPHLILCNRLKTHLFRKPQTSHSLLPESHPLSHISFPLKVIKKSLWERLLWLWPYLKTLLGL